MGWVLFGCVRRAVCAAGSFRISARGGCKGKAGGSYESDKAALSVPFNNNCTKLPFRSTDEAPRNRLRGLCPAPVSGATVVEVRPPLTLRPGECYAALADGQSACAGLDSDLVKKDLTGAP